MTAQRTPSLFFAVFVLASLGLLTGCGTGVSAVTGGASSGGSSNGSGGSSGSGGSGGGGSTPAAPVCTETPATPVSTTPTQPPAVASYQGGLFTGQVLAGPTPVVGATVQLYAAGTSGNGSAPVKLLPAGLVTDVTGTFSDNVAYTCPYNTSVLYLVASGGSVGSGSSNAGITLLSSPGLCSSVVTGAKFVINELTTVASAYAFAQFLSAGAQLGATATNASGITLAAGTFASLVNIHSGSLTGSAAASAALAGRLGSLADALNTCTTSTGSGSAACKALYAASTASGSSPTNTLDAAGNITQHPGASVGALYALSKASAAYGALAAAPADWTLFATYTGGGMNAPTSVSIDSAGRVWVANYYGGAASLFANTGAPVFPAGVAGNNLYESYGAAVDANDNIWITNEQTGYGINSGLGNLTVLNSAGQPVNGAAGYSAGGVDFPYAIAFDTTGVAWVVDYGDSHLTLLDSGGTPLSGAAGYGNGSFAFPGAVAVDSHRNGFVANQGSNVLVKVPADGSSFTAYTVSDQVHTSAVAVDEFDNAWVANFYGSSIGLVSACGQVLSGNGLTGGGIAYPQGLAIDGSGKAWVANYRGSSISELAAANSSQPGQILSPASGWAPEAGLVEAFGLAIDASGNIWVSSFGGNTLTEFIGMATPVRTPLIGPARVP